MTGPRLPAVLNHGFRPFFLLAGGWAALALLLWLAALHGAPLPEGPLPPARWHAHEMIAGFVGAAMIGFLLTAIPNWTGRRGYSGAPLLGLVALFVAARLALLPGSPLPPGAAAVVALLPVPALLALVAPSLVQARAARLWGPPALVTAFWVGDLLMLGEAAGWFEGGWAAGQLLALNVTLVLVGLIGGRIVPAFTLNALRKAGTPQEPKPIPGLDRLAILSLLAVAALDLLAPGGVAAGAVAGAAAALAALRLSRWHGEKTLSEPLLWVLHLAYALVPAALALKAAHLLLGAPWASGWLHLQGAGAAGLMILAVMTRATLGHTGRELAAGPAVTAAYLLLLAAVLARVFGPALAPPAPALAAAGALWIAAFGLYLLVFGPMLLRPRPDGKPG